MIKLICINPDCKYAYTVSENELKEYGQYHKKCLICGSKLVVAKESLVEIVKHDLLIQVKENVDKYIRELGIEGAWELIERNSDQSCARLYFDEFKRRGINLKKEK